MTQSSLTALSYDLIGAAIEVHSLLGPGLLEGVYEECLAEECRLRGMHVQRQVLVPIAYKGKELAQPLRLDLLINDAIIVEVKAVEVLLPVFQAQLLSYLKLAGKPKGILINFHVTNITQTAIHLVTEQFARLPKF
ncbi:MAG: GxxExxY protein [Bacteroidia bacterium]|nr:GxxExxY protein [Bacteroidia bacterium]